MVAELDAEMWQRYGEIHAQFAPHNKTDALATCVIALDGERPVGSGALRPYSAETIEIKRMFVAPAARGRGISKQILGELLAWAAELGFPAAILETGPLQPEAVGLYERAGFERTARYAPYLDQPTSICMRKSL
jgi:putative acetyltransferase